MRFGGATVTEDVEEDLFDIQCAMHDCDADMILFRFQWVLAELNGQRDRLFALKALFQETKVTWWMTVKRDSVGCNRQYSIHKRLTKEYTFRRHNTCISSKVACYMLDSEPRSRCFVQIQQVGFDCPSQGPRVRTSRPGTKQKLHELTWYKITQRLWQKDIRIVPVAENGQEKKTKEEEKYVTCICTTVEWWRDK